VSYFDEDSADRAANFFELLLKHTADEYYGTPFLLAPWEEDCISNLFGWKNDEGDNLIKLAYLEVPKKSGKTEFCAGLVTMALALSTTPRYEVYSAAAATKQALNVYRAACKMVEQHPYLSSRLRILRGTNRIVKRSDPDSFYGAIAADGDFSDGMNPALVICDEVHRWRTRKQLENWDVLTKSGITRRSRMAVAITTAGVRDESPLAWRLHEKALRIRDGIVADAGFYGRIYGADPSDDWHDEATWIKASPSLEENGGFLPIARLREVYEASLNDPEEQRAFRRYFLNLWDEKENRAINLQEWDACPLDWHSEPLLPLEPGRPLRTFPNEFLKLFVERTCYVGVDLSLTTDMSAITLVFPRDDGFDIVPFFYMPQSTVRKRELRDGLPYRTWADEGWIELHEGNVIDYGAIKARLKWASEMFDVRELCFDRYNSREMSTSLVADGIACVEVPQTYAGLSEATKRLLKAVSSGTLHHGANPVLKWNAACLATKSDNDLVRPVKPDRMRDTARIDGLAAAITGMSRAILSADTPDFEKRGLWYV
jgi:phage terminase large subunit-like protein